MQNNMMSINEKSRKIVFAVERRQKVGVAGIRMRHDYSTSLLGLGGFGVGGVCGRIMAPVQEEVSPLSFHLFRFLLSSSVLLVASSSDRRD